MRARVAQFNPIERDIQALQKTYIQALQKTYIQAPQCRAIEALGCRDIEALGWQPYPPIDSMDSRTRTRTQTYASFPSRRLPSLRELARKYFAGVE
jgi:hypothetical protein